MAEGAHNKKKDQYGSNPPQRADEQIAENGDPGRLRNRKAEKNAGDQSADNALDQTDVVPFLINIFYCLHVLKNLYPLFQAVCRFMLANLRRKVKTFCRGTACLCRACRPDGFGGKEKKKLVYYILRAVLFHKMDREMYCRAVKGGWPGSGKEHQRWEEDGLISGAEPSGRGITGILMSGYFPGAFPIKEE